MSNSFNITGKLHKKFEVEQKTPTFSVRDFVIEINENNYINYIKFQATGDYTSIIDAYNEGDEINVFFNLRGREWNDKYFTNLNAWKVEGASAAGAETFPEDQFENSPFPEADDMPTFDDETIDDDLPF